MIFESVMAMRNKLEGIGTMKGVIYAEKGVYMYMYCFWCELQS